MSNGTSEPQSRPLDPTTIQAACESLREVLGHSMGLLGTPDFLDLQQALTEVLRPYEDLTYQPEDWWSTFTLLNGRVVLVIDNHSRAWQVYAVASNQQPLPRP